MYNSLSPESHHVQCVWLSEWKISLTRISRRGIRRYDQFQFFSLKVSSLQSSYLNPLVLALFFVLTLQIYCFWVAGLRDQWPVWRWAQKAESSSAHPVFDPHFPWKRVSENGQTKCDSITIVVTNNVFSNNKLSMQFVSSTPSWSAGVYLSLLPEKGSWSIFPKSVDEPIGKVALHLVGTLLDLNGVFHMQPSTLASAAPQDINTPAMHSSKTYVISMEPISLYKHDHSLEGQWESCQARNPIRESNAVITGRRELSGIPIN